MKKLIIFGVVSLFFINNSNAHPRNHTRQKCNNSCNRGHISPRDCMAIAHQQQDVRLATRVAMSDGIITPGERRIIRQEKRQVKQTVYRAQTNGR